MGANYSSKDGAHNANQEDDVIPSRSLRSSTRTASPINHQHQRVAEGVIPPVIQVTDANSDPQSSTMIALSNIRNNVVPTVFKWEHGGRHVYITGTFNNWERQIPMHRSGNDFTYVHNLEKGKHAFKFVVDDEWRYAPDQPIIHDTQGRINNFIDISEFIPYTGDEHFFERSKERKISDDEFRNEVPDLDDYTKEPPALPPHLRHIILNKPTPSIDPQGLPVPQYVSLNHLYCTAIKDGLMVLGATQRYKEKFFTVVFYSVMPTAGIHY